MIKWENFKPSQELSPGDLASTPKGFGGLNTFWPQQRFLAE